MCEQIAWRRREGAGMTRADAPLIAGICLAVFFLLLSLLGWIENRRIAKELPCKHVWRPCVVRLIGWNECKPARKCDLCNEWEPLTEPEFYCLFGERLFVYSKRQIGK